MTVLPAGCSQLTRPVYGLCIVWIRAPLPAIAIRQKDPTVRHSIYTNILQRVRTLQARVTWLISHAVYLNCKQTVAL